MGCCGRSVRACDWRSTTSSIPYSAHGRPTGSAVRFASAIGAPPRAGGLCACAHLPVYRVCFVQSIVKSELAVLKDGTHVTVAADGAVIVRYHDDSRPVEAGGQLCAAAFAEAVVADLGDLVDEIDVKVDGERHAEGEARAHAGAIGAHRHVKIGSELGEIGHKVRDFVRIGTIDA